MATLKWIREKIGSQWSFLSRKDEGVTLGHGLLDCEVNVDVGLDFLDFGVEIIGLGRLDLGVLGVGFVNLEVRVTTLAKEFWTRCILLR